VSSGYVLNLGLVPYVEAWELQRSLAGAVSQGAIPDTVILLEHPPVVTLGRRAEQSELHIPADAEVELVETDRGGKSTYHGPGQLVCYPIFDLTRHGQDVKKYCRDLEVALSRTLEPLGIEATTIDGLTGLWLNATRPRSTRTDAQGSSTVTAAPAGDGQGHPAKIASIGVHIHKWVTTHGYALNVDLDTTPFTKWITACGLEDAAFTTIARELGRPVSVDEVRPHAVAALEEVFGLAFEALPAEDGHGLWAQPTHSRLAGRV
jgi:lipoyl(octanoyl) transferase